MGGVRSFESANLPNPRSGCLSTLTRKYGTHWNGGRLPWRSMKTLGGMRGYRQGLGNQSRSLWGSMHRTIPHCRIHFKNYSSQGPQNAKTHTQTIRYHLYFRSHDWNLGLELSTIQSSGKDPPG